MDIQSQKEIVEDFRLMEKIVFGLLPGYQAGNRRGYGDAYQGNALYSYSSNNHDDNYINYAGKEMGQTEPPPV